MNELFLVFCQNRDGAKIMRAVVGVESAREWMRFYQHTRGCAGFIEADKWEVQSDETTTPLYPYSQRGNVVFGLH